MRNTTLDLCRTTKIRNRKDAMTVVATLTSKATQQSFKATPVKNSTLLYRIKAFDPEGFFTHFV